MDTLRWSLRVAAVVQCFVHSEHGYLLIFVPLSSLSCLVSIAAVGMRSFEQTER
jgi:hypothetical protein